MVLFISYPFLSGTGSGGGEISIDEISGGGNSEYFGGGGKSVSETISSWRVRWRFGDSIRGGVGSLGVPTLGGVNFSGDPLGVGMVCIIGGGLNQKLNI